MLDEIVSHINLNTSDKEALLDKAQKLIEKKAVLPDAVNASIWSLLFHAFETPRNDLAKLILTIGSSYATGISVQTKRPNLDSGGIEGQTPLHLAAGAGNGKMVQYCLERCSNKSALIAEKDAQNRTALEVAAQQQEEAAEENNEEDVQKFEAVIMLLRNAAQTASPTPKLGRCSPLNTAQQPTASPSTVQTTQSTGPSQRLKNSRE